MNVFSSPRRQGLWWLAFLLLFGLSLDFWSWGGTPPIGPFGLPWWIYYFIGLQLVFAVLVRWYFKRTWPEEREDRS